MKMIVVLVAGLVATSAYAQCTKDTDCKGDRICSKGVCEAPSSNAPIQSTPQVAAPVLSEAEILTKYLNGDAATARAEADRAGLKSLAEKIAALDAAYSAGVVNRDAKQTDVAISRYEEALTIDATITKESSKYARSIHRSLSKLYVDRAEQKFGTSDLPAAREALNTALVHNGENDEAKAKLEELNKATRSPFSTGMDPSASRTSSRTKVSLLDEKDRLLASMPSLGGPITVIVLTIVAATIITAVGAALLWSPLALGLIIGVEVLIVVIASVALGSNIGTRVRINRRISEIERTLERMAFAPNAPEQPKLVVWRF